MDLNSKFALDCFRVAESEEKIRENSSSLLCLKPNTEKQKEHQQDPNKQVGA